MSTLQLLKRFVLRNYRSKVRIIVPLIVEKLDYTSRKEWQATLNSEIPKLTDLNSFLEKRCKLLESRQQISLNASHSTDIDKHSNNFNKNFHQGSTAKQRWYVQAVAKDVVTASGITYNTLPNKKFEHLNSCDFTLMFSVITFFNFFLFSHILELSYVFF